MIEFIVPSVPIAQPRQRHANIGGQIRNYLPKDNPVWSFKAAVQVGATSAYQGAPLDYPLRVDIEFVFPRPKAMVWKTKPMPRLWCGKKPDRDNLEKAVYDALNGILWVDDALICDGRIQKFYAAGDEQPHVKITVNAAGEL